MTGARQIGTATGTVRRIVEEGGRAERATTGSVAANDGAVTSTETATGTVSCTLVIAIADDGF